MYVCICVSLFRNDPRGNYQSLRKRTSPNIHNLPSPKLSEVNNKMDTRKNKASMHETTVSETSSSEDSPLCELRVPLRTKGRPRKILHDSDEAEEQLPGTGKGIRGRRMKLPVKKSSKSKQSDSSDERQSSSKGTRRVPQAQNQELDSSNHTDSEGMFKTFSPRYYQNVFKMTVIITVLLLCLFYIFLQTTKSEFLDGI